MKRFEIPQATGEAPKEKAYKTIDTVAPGGRYTSLNSYAARLANPITLDIDEVEALLRFKNPFDGDPDSEKEITNAKEFVEKLRATDPGARFSNLRKISPPDQSLRTVHRYRFAIDGQDVEMESAVMFQRAPAVMAAMLDQASIDFPMTATEWKNYRTELTRSMHLSKDEAGSNEDTIFKVLERALYHQLNTRLTEEEVTDKREIGRGFCCVEDDKILFPPDDYCSRISQTKSVRGGVDRDRLRPIVWARGGGQKLVRIGEQAKKAIERVWFIPYDPDRVTLDILVTPQATALVRPFTADVKELQDEKSATEWAQVKIKRAIARPYE